MVLLSYVRQLAAETRVCWLVPDSEAVVGALLTYQQGGQCGDGIYHLYATMCAGSRVVTTSAIKVIKTPSHWMGVLNIRSDALTHDPPDVDVTWLLCRALPFFWPRWPTMTSATSPLRRFMTSFKSKASIPARFGPNFLWFPTCRIAQADARTPNLAQRAAISCKMKSKEVNANGGQQGRLGAKK